MKKDPEPARIRDSRQRGRRKDSHAVRLALPVVLTILFPVGGIYYLCGRFSPVIFSFVNICMIYPIVIVFMFWCFFAGIVKLSGRREKCTRNEKLLIIAETSIPLVFVGLLLAPLPLSKESIACGPGPGLVAVGLRHRVESEVDIAATRAWLQSLDPEKCVDYYHGFPLPELPESLRGLGAGARLYADENSNSKISLSWGGTPSGHWGIVIGMEDMKTPPSEFRPQVKHIVPVEPGVYVWWGE